MTVLSEDEQQIIDRFEYSERVLSIDFINVESLIQSGFDDQIVVDIYPNPIGDEKGTLKIKFGKSTFAKIYSVGLRGNRLNLLKEGFFPMGITEFPINVSGIPNGLSLIRVVTNETSQVIKFIKI